MAATLRPCFVLVMALAFLLMEGAAMAAAAGGLPEQQRRQVRSLLRRLNKPPVETIQVYPELYGDSYTRLFIYWTRDAYQRTGCYNLLCSGFIQTNNQVSIGASFSPMSIYGGLQYETDILVWKDTKGAGNWWLQVGDEIMGYWPSTIFSYLQISASYVAWGGEVYSPLAGQTSTDMGSGHFSGEGFGKASYMKNLQVVDSFNTLNPPLSGVGLASEQPNCYNVQSGTDSVNWGTYIFYGGPGKNPSCPYSKTN
nr:unnamed protein product [Digitaria exilis]